MVNWFYYGNARSNKKTRTDMFGVTLQAETSTLHRSVSRYRCNLMIWMHTEQFEGVSNGDGVNSTSN